MHIFDDQYVQKILNNIEDGVFITDENGIAIWMNDTSLQQLGASRSYLIGKDVKELEQDGYFTPSVTTEVIKQNKTISKAQESLERQYLATGKKLSFPGKGNDLIMTQVKDITNTVRTSLQIEKAEYLLKKYWEELQEVKQTKSKAKGKTLIIGNSPQHKEMMRLIEQIAPYDATILLQGETGVGKSMIAKEIHRLSNRGEEPFIQINCGAIPETLLESELFGYKKGAFTGASQGGKKGLVSKADGGTLFLDEIAELPITLQPKILQLIQDKSFIPVGGTSIEYADIRIISATNENLLQKIETKEFRKDLYYRLNVVSVTIPSLRERKSDIISLLYHYLNVYMLKYGKEITFSDDILHILKQYEWPGNIRELENIVERLVVTTSSKQIEAYQLPDSVEQMSNIQENTFGIQFDENSLQDYLERIEKNIVQKAQQQFPSTRKAAEYLGLTQSSYMRRLKKYQINQ